MAELEITIQGVPSGDWECWCLLVTKEDYRRVRGKDPEEHDEGPFAQEASPYRYKLYPDDLIVSTGDDVNSKPVISLKVKSFIQGSL